MAKTAEQKAAAAVAKAESKPTAANVAAAAKAVALAANDTKQEAKAAAAEAKSQFVALKDSQALATTALKQEGASKTEVNAAKDAAKTELITAVTGMFASPTQTMSNTTTQILATNTTTAAVNAQARLDAAVQASGLLQAIPGMAPSEASMTANGISLQSIDKRLEKYDATGSFGTTALSQALQNVMVDWQPYLDPATNSFTLPASVLEAEGKIKSVGEGIYKVTNNTGVDDNINKTTQYFVQNPDGTYTLTATDKYNYNAPPEESGLGTLGGLIGAGLGLALGPAGWGVLGSNLAAGAVGGAVGGALSTGDIQGLITGGLLGGLGGGITDYLSGTGLFTPDGSFVGPQTGSVLEAGAQTSGATSFPVTNPYAGLTGTDLGALSTAAGSVATQTPAPVADASLSWIKPGEVVNLNGTNYLGLGSAGGLSLGSGTATTAAQLTQAVSAAGGLMGLVGSGATIGGIPLSSILTTGTGILGGVISGNAAQDAAEQQAETQLKIAEMMRFKPVGVSTRFGSSQFGYDANGNLTSAGYTLAPDVKAQQDTLMGLSNNYLAQYQGAQAATAPMGTAAQQAMTLGNQYLMSTPEQQAAKYMADQQALLAPTRERELAALENRLLQQGRLGLATGGTSTGMMAANPELEAYANAKRMQDLQLATQATQAGQQYAQFGAGLVGTGGDLLNSMYGTQAAAYNPYQTAIGGAQYLESLGQKAMDLGTSLGAQQTTANANTANYMNQAATTQATANSYSPWGSLLTGAGTALSNLQSQQAAQQAALQQQQLNAALLANLNKSTNTIRG